MMPDLLSLTLTLLAVLPSVAGTAWLLHSARRARGGPCEQIHLAASLCVGSRERVVLIEVAGQRLLLGVAPGHVSTLAQLPAQSLGSEAPSEPQRNPASWLATYLGKINAK